MRTHPLLKPWLSLAGSLLLVAGAVAFTVMRSGAAGLGLWTEGSRAAPAAAAPWVAVAKADTPAVVNISATQVTKNPPLSGDGDGDQGPLPEDLQQFMRRFLGEVPRNFRTHSLGSGFFIRSDGYIVTNDHMVDGATEVAVKLSDGREFPAKVVGCDEKTDLALLKIDAKGLPVLPLGDSDKLNVGEPVLAIGNPFGLQGTVTGGIVSGKGRIIGQGPYDQFIQTDASINPGNSGGPLVNRAGEVVGVNTVIVSGSGGSVGVGFAIPINEAKAILPQLQAKGHVTRGSLGVAVQPVTPELAKALHLPNGQGALVAQVAKDSPAAVAGLQAGDVIVAYDGHQIPKESDLPGLVADTPIGREVAIVAVRDGREVRLTARIVELPAPRQPAAGTTPSASSGGAKLGIGVHPLTPELARELGVQARSGVVVTAVQPGGPAAEAGIRQGDVIVLANRKPVRTVNDLRQAMNAGKGGEPTLLQIQRKDASLFVAVPARG